MLENKTLLRFLPQSIRADFNTFKCYEVIIASELCAVFLIPDPMFAHYPDFQRIASM